MNREEEIARIIDRDAFIHVSSYAVGSDLQQQWVQRKNYALEKARAILSQPHPDLSKAVEALKPFAKDGWLIGECDYSNLTIIAHIHASPRHELVLGSDDFRRAREAYESLKG